MPDTLFGITVPSQTDIAEVPGNVFPLDPDFGFTKKRKWDTRIHKFGPHLEQRFPIRSTPEISFRMGFSAMKGAYADPTSSFQKLWLFYLNRRGRGIPFWFYDPILWKVYPAPANSTGLVPYRDYPVLRMTHPGGLGGAEAGFTKTTGRYLCIFEEEEMSVEVFEYRLRKSNLSVRGYLA